MKVITPAEFIDYNYWGDSFKSEKEILAEGGNYNISQFDLSFSVPDLEYPEIYGTDSTIYFSAYEPIHTYYTDDLGTQYHDYDVDYHHLSTNEYELYEDSIVIIGWNYNLEVEAKVKLNLIEKNNALIVATVETVNFSELGNRSYGKVWFRIF